MTAAPTMMTQTDPGLAPLLAAAELWTLDAGQLTVASGTYGPHLGLKAAGAETRLDGGEGAVGEAFQTGTARIVAHVGEIGYLYRDAAAEAGVEASVLLPYVGAPEPDAPHGSVRGVLSLLLRGERPGDAASKGAAELWAGTKGRFELSLEQSHYVGLDRFARVSQFVNFPLGAGLPGLSWANATAELVPDVATAKGFLRSSGAESDGLSVGLGLPVLRGSELRSVLLLISSRASPMACVHEVWKAPGVAPADGQAQSPTPMTRDRGTYAGRVAVAEATSALGERGSALVEQARRSGLPVLIDGPEAMREAEPDRADALERAGLHRAVALPVPTLHGVRSVAVLFL